MSDNEWIREAIEANKSREELKEELATLKKRIAVVCGIQVLKQLEGGE